MTFPMHNDFKINAHRPTWAEIDLDVLASNYHSIKSYVTPGLKVMAVVKADAYGHGAVECARRLEKEGADWFGVALPEEGIELRKAGISSPILCLTGFWEGQEGACIKHNLVPVITCEETAAALNRAASDAGVIATVHVKVDTGMGRLGFRFEEARDVAARMANFKHLRVAGLMTHFAAADDPACQELTINQIERFNEVVSVFRNYGIDPELKHLANSAAIYARPAAWGNMIRPGGILYGLWRDILMPTNEEPELKPVMTIRSRITLLKWVTQGETIGYGCTFEASRQTLVATLPIGYHDGYMRGLSNRAHVIVGGKFAPVIGRISMDLTLIDVTGLPSVELGDEVTLLGTAEQGEVEGKALQVTAEDLARISGTLSYEVTCGLSRRVPRYYLSK